MQHDRRTNPYPWTWEPAAVALLGYVLLAFMSIHVARAVANLLAGAGWTMTASGHWIGATPGILSGDAAAGLAPGPEHQAPEVLLYSCVGFGQFLLLAVVARVCWTLARRYGPSRLRGAATPRQADEMLGLQRLRRNASIIRPDLYGAEQP